ncbi:MAG: glycosyltransferase [Lachnospiraceae bacterium]|nr:glycosyltransferase [Lachnospiraceae bacterium]
MAKVSVCIPAYKDAAGIKRLLNSIYASEYTDIDIIITDDTPDDSVKKAVDEFIRANGVSPSDVLKSYDENIQADIFGFIGNFYKDVAIRIEYYHNESPLGPGENWNKCLSLADGEYIKFMHQDDWFTDPKSLGCFVDMLDEDPNAILAYSGSRQVSINEEDPFDISEYYDRCITKEHKTLLDADWRNFYIGQYIGAPSATIYRNCDIRFDPQLQWIIDSDFYMKLLSGGGHMVCSLEPLVSIGVSNGQLTNLCAKDKIINIREYKYVFNKYKLGFRNAYREKLINICVRYGGRYSDISDCGITKEEYKPVLSVYRAELRKFYFDLILKKLHLRSK